MDTSELIKKVVDEINEEALYQTEKRVKTLVDDILLTNDRIAILAEHLVKCKQELKALQLPVTKSVEL